MSGEEDGGGWRTGVMGLPLSVGLPGGLWMGGAECTISSNSRGNWRAFEWPKDGFSILEEEKKWIIQVRRDNSAVKLYFLYGDSWDLFNQRLISPYLLIVSAAMASKQKSPAAKSSNLVRLWCLAQRQEDETCNICTLYHIQFFHIWLFKLLMLWIFPLSLTVVFVQNLSGQQNL